MEIIPAIWVFLLIAIFSQSHSTLGLNICCDFENEICANKWIQSNVDVRWTWTDNNTYPADPDDSYDINETNNYWLENANITDGSSDIVTILASYRLEENDVIKFRIYTKLNTPNQLSVQIKSVVEEIITLFSADQPGWKDYSFKCTKGNCCTEYPCTPQIQVVGRISDPSDLLAFDDFRINDCAI
ncbi:hypothetical protein CHUAL_003596 [Chamberlinius hualienensis]